MCRDPEYNDIKTKGLSTLIADCLFQNITIIWAVSFFPV